MSIFDIILLILGGIGMTLIIVDGTIFSPLRVYIETRANQVNEGKEVSYLSKVWPKLHKLVNCYQCTGLWCGVISMLLLYSPFEMATNIILGGCAISFVSMLGMAMINYLDSR